MTADVRWKVVTNDLPAIAQRMAATAETLVAKAALDLEAHMKARVPVDTGNLKNSIQAVQVNSQAWRVTVGAEYGAYVEYGTTHTAPQPFFNPAVDTVLPQFRAAWSRLVSA